MNVMSIIILNTAIRNLLILLKEEVKDSGTVMTELVSTFLS